MTICKHFVINVMLKKAIVLTKRINVVNYKKYLFYITPFPPKKSTNFARCLSILFFAITYTDG